MRARPFWLGLLFLGLSGFAIADVALKDASDFVRARAGARHLMAEQAVALPEQIGLKRFYAPGDRWVVAVTRISPGAIRHTGDKKAHEDVILDPVYYEFRVEGVDATQANLSVEPIGLDGEALLNERVPRARLTIDRAFHIKAKQYFYRDLAAPITADFEGPQNMPMGFDAYPFELPNFERARVLEAAELSKLKLPAGVVKQLSRRPVAAEESVLLEDRDLFARPVTVSWRKGDVWPAFVKTNGGYSVLVSMTLARSSSSTVAPSLDSAPLPRPTGYYDEQNFAKLYKRYRKAVADPVPWVGFWWPYVENGIADGTFDRSQLAPTDKIDQVFNNSNWATGWEYSNHGKGRRAADWWGHCNGWATAAIMEQEPRHAIKRDGVNFSVGDRKALLSEYWMEVGADYIGTRVWNGNDTSSGAFWDVVPAQFHLLMTNIVGRQRRSVIVDRHTGYEVWNQPVVAYEIGKVTADDYRGRDARYNNLYRIEVTTTLWWANDEVSPNDVTPLFEWQENDFFTKRQLRYELWLDGPVEFDSRGEVVSSGDVVLSNSGYGGQWMNGTNYETVINSHPDFIWVPLSYARSSGYKNPRINDAWIHSELAAMGAEEPARKPAPRDPMPLPRVTPAALGAR